MNTSKIVDFWLYTIKNKFIVRIWFREIVNEPTNCVDSVSHHTGSCIKAVNRIRWINACPIDNERALFASMCQFYELFRCSFLVLLSFLFIDCSH